MEHYSNSQLGKKSEYSPIYDATKLFPIERQKQRETLGIRPGEKLPFFGFDIWNHYEVSWLNEKGKPIVAMAEIIYPCYSACLVESKSLKLYFNSFNNTKFKDQNAVKAIIQKDLTQAIGEIVEVNILTVNENKFKTVTLEGICIDNLDVACHTYRTDPSLLKTDDKIIEETLYSDLLKSNCLVTGQPDWGTVQISYKGKQINHGSLLQYIVSFRDHTEFGEHCIERIFMDIMRQCKPEKLTVYGRYTRRGGLDINPYRSTENNTVLENKRLFRQ